MGFPSNGPHYRTVDEQIKNCVFKTLVKSPIFHLTKPNSYKLFLDDWALIGDQNQGRYFYFGLSFFFL